MYKREFVAALKQCSKKMDLEGGKTIHEQVRQHGLDIYTNVGNTLMEMYRKCRSMQLAKEVFESMTHKDVFTWTCLITGYVENGESSVALNLFANMDCEPNHVTYVAVLKACTCLAKSDTINKQVILEKGMDIHREIKERAFESNVILASALVDMYSKCGRIHLATEVFNRMTYKNVVTWTCLILGYVENGESSVALELFHNMDCEANHVTYIAALKACIGLASERETEKQDVLKKGVAIHEQLKERAFDSKITVANTLVDMYCKCGSVQLARRVFEGMSRKDVVTWTCLIMGYVVNGENSVALDLFETMDCEPDRVTCLAALKVCASLASERELDRRIVLEKGVAIHEELKERAFDSDVSVASALVDMYSKCDNMQGAREVFERMIRKDVITWTCLILGYVENGESSVALDLFTNMDCEPNQVTCIAALRACITLASEREAVLERGRAIHELVKELAYDTNIIVASTLVEMYSKCGKMQLAREVFDGMVNKDVVTWNCLVLGYVENGEKSVALDLFASMDCEPNHVTYIAALKACTGETLLEKGMAIHKQVKQRAYESNISVASTLVDMYSKCRAMHLARDVFERMVTKDVVTWNCLVLGYVENRESSEALNLFFSMDCEAKLVTYIGVLKACGNLTAVTSGREIHGTICKLGLEGNDMIATVLVDFYGRCGCIATSIQVFSGLQCVDIVSWNALLVGYSESSQLVSLVREMQESGVELDAATFVCILSACSHAGMVEEGEAYFKCMQKHGITLTVKHYTCLVDMLCRANKFDEAVSVLRSMRFEANEVTWMTVLDGCRKWNNLQVAKVAFDRLVSGDTHYAAAAYVVIGDIYRSLGMLQR